LRGTGVKSSGTDRASRTIGTLFCIIVSSRCDSL
jgi:hypothetical protein